MVIKKVTERSYVYQYIELDERFTQEEINQISIGMEDWNWSIYNKKLVLLYGFDMSDMRIQHHMEIGSWLILKVDNNWENKPMDRDGIFVPAWSNAIGGDKIFIIGDRVPIKDMRGVIVHELGHLLGARHVEGGIMNGIYVGYVGCVDKKAAEQVGDIDKMNYCK